jgi:Ca2+-transporting ATPase
VAEFCSKVNFSPRKDVKKLNAQNEALAKDGYRVIALAVGKVTKKQKYSDADIKNLEFMGLVGFIDPIRKEAIASIRECHTAGIKVLMITGDHPLTAFSIARDLKLATNREDITNGEEVEKYYRRGEKDFDEFVASKLVFARVTPLQKLYIVDSLKRQGEFVAVTGDGVNDAPALKKADIGVAMGITGTEVSKDAASMILADDNFATIIKAVANGRVIFNNIKNAVLYLLSGNMSAIIAVLYTSLLALPIPFKAVQLLFINLVTDSLPALAIGMEPGDDSVLKQKPRDPHQGIMDRKFITLMMSQGLLIAICVITAFYLGLKQSATMASSMAFTTLTLARLLHGFNCRSEESLFTLGFKRNMWSLYAFLTGIVLLALVMFVPAVTHMFGVASMSTTQVGCVIGLALVPTIIIQIIKVVREHR